jgi:hypothetical protein
VFFLPNPHAETKDKPEDTKDIIALGKLQKCLIDYINVKIISLHHNIKVNM